MKFVSSCKCFVTDIQYFIPVTGNTINMNPDEVLFSIIYPTANTDVCEVKCD